MGYRLSKDIDEQGVLDVQVLNTQMGTATNRVVAELDALTQLDERFRFLVRFILKSFITTHASIIAILRHGNQEKYDGDKTRKANVLFAADAMSLLREQLEKVFMIALLCDNPEKWTTRWEKDDWRRLYRGYLLDRDERQDLQRFKDFGDSKAPRFLENLRLSAGVTEDEKKAVEFKFNNPDQALPAELRDARIKRFPSPGEARGEITNTSARELLNRLYEEYLNVSGYSHIGQAKLQALMMTDRTFRTNVDEHRIEEYYQKEMELPSVLGSYLAHIIACTEVSKFMPEKVDVLAALTKQWEELKRGSLLAIAMWDIRAAHVLPPTIGI